MLVRLSTVHCSLSTSLFIHWLVYQSRDHCDHSVERVSLDYVEAVSTGVRSHHCP